MATPDEPTSSTREPVMDKSRGGARKPSTPLIGDSPPREGRSDSEICRLLESEDKNEASLDRAEKNRSRTQSATPASITELLQRETPRHDGPNQQPRIGVDASTNRDCEIDTNLGARGLPPVQDQLPTAGSKWSRNANLKKAKAANTSSHRIGDSSIHTKLGAAAAASACSKRADATVVLSDSSSDDDGSSQADIPTSVMDPRLLNVGSSLGKSLSPHSAAPTSIDALRQLQNKKAQSGEGPPTSIHALKSRQGRYGMSQASEQPPTSISELRDIQGLADHVGAGAHPVSLGAYPGRDADGSPTGFSQPPVRRSEQRDRKRESDVEEALRKLPLSNKTLDGKNRRAQPSEEEPAPKKRQKSIQDSFQPAVPSLMKLRGELNLQQERDKQIEEVVTRKWNNEFGHCFPDLTEGISEKLAEIQRAKENDDDWDDE